MSSKTSSIVFARGCDNEMDERTPEDSDVTKPDSVVSRLRNATVGRAAGPSSACLRSISACFCSASRLMASEMFSALLM